MRTRFLRRRCFAAIVFIGAVPSLGTVEFECLGHGPVEGALVGGARMVGMDAGPKGAVVAALAVVQGRLLRRLPPQGEPGSSARPNRSFDCCEPHPARGAWARVHVDWRMTILFSPKEASGGPELTTLAATRVTQMLYADGTADVLRDSWREPRPRSRMAGLWVGTTWLHGFLWLELTRNWARRDGVSGRRDRRWLKSMSRLRMEEVAYR